LRPEYSGHVWAYDFVEGRTHDGRKFRILTIIDEARVLIEAWRRHYNTVRPHSSLGYRPPAPEAAPSPLPLSGSASLHRRPTPAVAFEMGT
jgi:hypothetical protein